MKIPAALAVCVFFAIAAMLPARAQTAPAPAPAPAGNPLLDNKPNTMDDLIAAITKQPYTFVAGGYTMHITFKSDGKGDEGDWKCNWHAKDAQTIELTLLDKKGKPTDKKTTFTFSDDYSSYTGFHFDGIKKVSGHTVQVQH